MFIFKYKEICIDDHYAPFTPSVTPDETTFMFLPVSSTQDITSGFFQYGNSASSAALPRSTFSKIIHNARQIWAWPSHLLSERTAGPSERHKWLWIIQLVNDYSVFQNPITSTKKLGKPWRYLFKYVSSVWQGSWNTAARQEAAVKTGLLEIS